MDDELEQFESQAELRMYQEYRDVLPMFRYVVETERRFYLANQVEVSTNETLGSGVLEIAMEDAWVWDMYRPARFLQRVRVITFNDVNIEELERSPRV